MLPLSLSIVAVETGACWVVAEVAVDVFKGAVFWAAAVAKFDFE